MATWGHLVRTIPAGRWNQSPSSRLSTVEARTCGEGHVRQSAPGCDPEPARRGRRGGARRPDGRATLSNPNNKISRNPGPDDEFTVHVGTAGSGAGSFAYMDYGPVPRDAFPVLEVEYAAKNPGDPPIREKYELKERC
jgi:hypothetical protein